MPELVAAVSDEVPGAVNEPEAVVLVGSDLLAGAEVDPPAAKASLGRGSIFTGGGARARCPSKTFFAVTKGGIGGSPAAEPTGLLGAAFATPELVKRLAPTSPAGRRHLPVGIAFF